jgi:L-lysine 2,3-aminomutase
MLETYKKQAEALASLSLEELLEMEKEFEISLEKTSREAERLEKRLRMVRQELREYKEASKKANIKFEETPLYKHLMDFLEENEKFLKEVEIKNGELLALLYAIAHKIKEKEKKKDLGKFKKE